MIYRFHHIHLLCSDLETTIDFFIGMLGAKLAARQKFGGADGASLDLNGTTVNPPGGRGKRNRPCGRAAARLWLSSHVRRGG